MSFAKRLNVNEMWHLINIQKEKKRHKHRSLRNTRYYWCCVRSMAFNKDLFNPVTQTLNQKAFDAILLKLGGQLLIIWGIWAQYHSVFLDYGCPRSHLHKLRLSILIWLEVVPVRLRWWYRQDMGLLWTCILLSISCQQQLHVCFATFISF